MHDRLFQVTDTHTRKPVPGHFFADKPSAKEVRRALNKQANETLRYIVSPGPDHRRFRK